MKKDIVGGSGFRVGWYADATGSKLISRKAQLAVGVQKPSSAHGVTSEGFEPELDVGCVVMELRSICGARWHPNGVACSTRWIHEDVYQRSDNTAHAAPRNCCLYQNQLPALAVWSRHKPCVRAEQEVTCRLTRAMMDACWSGAKVCT